MFNWIKKLINRKNILLSTVIKSNNTGYVFWDINDDLGKATETTGKSWNKSTIMAYGHARMIAISALYIQGIVKKETYDYVNMIFHGMKLNFDEVGISHKKAFREALAFIQSYNKSINENFAKYILSYAQVFSSQPKILSDEELFKITFNAINSSRRHILPNNKKNYDEVSAAIEQITKGVNKRIPSKQIAYQFVLQELDAARHGNEKAVQFVLDSGFNPIDYEGAMENSCEEVDGPNGPQQFLRESVMQLSKNEDAMVHISTNVVNNIINIWELRA